MTRGAAPLLSVCIPAYNRAAQLPETLGSVFAQAMSDFEVVIHEDHSAEREAIAAVVREWSAKHPGHIRYIENARTLGYDGNVRALIASATGRWCYILGNDDLVAPGAFATIASALERHAGVGVILRSFAFFEGSPDNVVQVSRYYPSARRFPAGPEAFLACYRRLVVMSGLVFDRALAHAHATDRFDGSLFYQHWVCGNILLERDALFLPDILALFRRGGVPEFGAARAERGRFTPGHQPPDTDLKMIRALIDIAGAIDDARGVHVRDAVVRDLGNYGYHTLVRHAREPFRVRWRFYRDLGALGLARRPLYHFWFVLLNVLGPARAEQLIQWIRRRVGHTPNLTRAVARAGTTIE